MIKKIGYILFALWLVTIISSNVLWTIKSLNAELPLVFSKKEQKEKPSENNDAENKKKSAEEDNSENKSENEDADKFFECNKNHQIPSLYLGVAYWKNAIHIADEHFICTFSIDLESPPPEV